MPFKGRRHTPETKRKMADAARGRKLSDATKAKLSHKSKAMWRAIKQLKGAVEVPSAT